MGRSTGVEPGAVQGGEALRFGEKFLVSPDPVAEAEGGTTGEALLERRCAGGGMPRSGRGAAPRPVAEREWGWRWPDVAGSRCSVPPCYPVSAEATYPGRRATAMLTFSPDRAGCQPAAAAHRHERQIGVPALELVQGRGDEPAPGRPDRVTQGDGPTVDVHLVPVDAMSSFCHEQTTEANASLTSKMSMSGMVMPALVRTLVVAAMGPSSW